MPPAQYCNTRAQYGDAHLDYHGITTISAVELQVYGPDLTHVYVLVSVNIALHDPGLQSVNLSLRVQRKLFYVS